MRVDQDFSDFAAARWTRLVRSAVLLGCREFEAEDIAQTTLEKCLVNWHRVQRAADRDAYVHKVLLNTFISSKRRRWRTELPSEEIPDRAGVDETAAVDDVDAVVRALGRLTRDHRVAIVMRFYAQLNEQQMATVLDVAPGTIKSRLSRALTTLAADPALAEVRGLR